jgi:subtilase family serine protease
MEIPYRKIIAITLIFIMVISSLAVLDNSIHPAITPINKPDNSNETAPTLLAYIPSALQSDVGNDLNSSGVHYKYYGNLLNVNYSTNRGEISYVFSELNRTYGIQYFIFNSSDDFIPYVQSPDYQVKPYTPSNIYNAYDMNYIHNEGYYGNNTTIVVVDAYGDPSLNYDVSVFDNVTGLPPANITVTTPEGAITSTNSGWASETAIDVEWSHAIAPGAKIDLVLAPGDGSRLLDSVAYAISHRLGNIISLSWGEAESDLTPVELVELNDVYKQAALENITVVAASGDEGADDGTSHLAVNFPASDPYVLGVGGTTLYQTATGFCQTAWGDVVNGKVQASGGGFSSYFSTPYYQIAPNYTEILRGVPDVSMDANPSTGVLVVVDGQESTLGGTSIATPMWAGIIAIMDQYFDRSLGLVNPIFYKISETKYYTNAFTQITSGSNYGYSAGPGWNPVTGLGTPLVSNLINDSALVVDGYGTVALLNNTSYATSISGNIKVTQNNVEEFNGSTYYYLGFYENSSNYIKFGISANITGYYYKYSIYENGIKTEGLMPGSSSTNMGIDISGTEISFLVNDRIEKTFNMPLSFAGDYRAAVGAQQDNAKINFVNIPHASYTNLTISNSSGPIIYTGVYQSGYSNIGTNYSNITFKYYKSNNTMIASKGVETNKQINGTHGSVNILYNIKFGTESTLTFRLSNGVTATYNINGKSFPSSIKLPGGTYTVTATYNDKNISREIYVPVINSVNLTVNSTPSYYKPEYNLVIDHYFNYTSSDSSISVYELLNNNNASISSTGYYAGYANGNNITSITLVPEKVLVNVFVPNGNATVIINGATSETDGGYHSLYVIPGPTTVNVTDYGYISNNQTVNLIPGIAENLYVLLYPENTTINEVTGTVENIQYHYGLNNVNITESGKTLGYTNNSGQFVLFLNNKTDLTFHENLYLNNTTIISPESNNIVYMTPESVSVLVFNFKITYTLPLGFYYAFVSWDKYPASNFAEYVVAYSNNSLMLNSHTSVITSKGTDFTFLPGLTIGKTYYVMVDAYSVNGAFISSNEVSVHYSLISYLITFLIFLGILSYIVFILMYFIRRKKRKKALEDDEFDYFRYN